MRYEWDAVMIYHGQKGKPSLQYIRGYNLPFINMTFDIDEFLKYVFKWNAGSFAFGA